MSRSVDLSFATSFPFGSGREPGTGGNEDFDVLWLSIGDLNGDNKPAVDGMLKGVLGRDEDPAGDKIMLGKNESFASFWGLSGVSIVNHKALARRRPPFPTD